MLTFHITLNDDDFIMFNLYHLFNSQAGKRTMLINRWLVPIVFAMLVLLTAVIEQDTALLVIKISFFIIISIVWLFQVKKIMIRSIRNQILQTKKQGRLPYFAEVDLVFDEHVIRETHPDGMSEVRYTALEKVAISTDAIYLYFSTSQAFIIPSTYVATEPDKQQIIDFLLTKKPDLLIVR